MSALDQIDTIVIVMMENRSFDHLLGHLSHPNYGNRKDVNGLGDVEHMPQYTNFYGTVGYPPKPMRDQPLTSDLPHKRGEIHAQLDFMDADPMMTGFVKSFVDSTKSRPDPMPCMGFLTPQDLPITAFFANEYMVCDNWFSPLPAGTQANRAMAYTGTTLIEDNVTGIIPHDQLVLDWLTERDIPWRVYHSGLSFFLLFNPLQALFKDNFRPVEQLAAEFKQDKGAKVPRVIFVEPSYDDSPIHLRPPNDNHPPLSMAGGEDFLKSVYSALTANPKRWQRTLLVVTYDEHGGFFDHEPPPAIKMPLPPNAQYHDPFVTAGVRVPGMIVSPLVERRSVCKALLDHTSILQLLAEKFAGGPENYNPAVTGRRKQGIESLSVALTRQAPRTDMPLTPVAPISGHIQFRSGYMPPVTPNQLAFELAARMHLKEDPRKAMSNFPELAHLPA